VEILVLTVILEPMAAVFHQITFNLRLNFNSNKDLVVWGNLTPTIK
jgi:hypothetical protein